MTCRDAVNLLPLFFDGELDANQMRSVALHSTRCGNCEDELRRMEQVQEMVSTHVNAAIDEVDFAALWRGIDQRLGTVRVSWWSRARAWWSEGEHGWMIKLPAFAAAAAVAALGFVLWTRMPASTPQPDAAVVANLDNAASIDSLESDGDAVTVVNDPETRTTVLWVSDDPPGGEGTP